MPPGEQAVFSIENRSRRTAKEGPTHKAKWIKTVLSDTVEIDDQRQCREVFNVFGSCLWHLKLCGVWRGCFVGCIEGVPNAHGRYKW